MLLALYCEYVQKFTKIHDDDEIKQYIQYCIYTVFVLNSIEYVLNIIIEHYVLSKFYTSSQLFVIGVGFELEYLL